MRTILVCINAKSDKSKIDMCITYVRWLVLPVSVVCFVNKIAFTRFWGKNLSFLEKKKLEEKEPRGLKKIQNKF